MFELLVVVIIILFVLVLYLWNQSKDKLYTEAELKKIIELFKEKQRPIVKGQIGENIAPYMKEFIKNYNPGDVRFLGGEPVDYIVYKNYVLAKNKDEKIEEIVFVEVKTGKAQLNSIERKIKEAIEKKRVRYDVIRLKSMDEKEKTE